MEPEYVDWPRFRRRALLVGVPVAAVLVTVYAHDEALWVLWVVVFGACGFFASMPPPRASFRGGLPLRARVAVRPLMRSTTVRADLVERDSPDGGGATVRVLRLGPARRALRVVRWAWGLVGAWVLLVCIGLPSLADHLEGGSAAGAGASAPPASVFTIGFAGPPAALSVLAGLLARAGVAACLLVPLEALASVRRDGDVLVLCIGGAGAGTVMRFRGSSTRVAGLVSRLHELGVDVDPGRHDLDASPLGFVPPS